MSTTTPDIRQLSTCCGELLAWNQNNPGGWTAVCPRCEEQRFWSRPADGRPCRKLTATEDLLFEDNNELRTRIAELEAAQRWRVTAEYSPHEGDRVLGLRGGEPEVMTYGEEGLDHPYLWSTADYSGVDAPGYWMPIPAVPVALSQGADVPNGEQNAR